MPYNKKYINNLVSIEECLLVLEVLQFLTFFSMLKLFKNTRGHISSSCENTCEINIVQSMVW